LICTRAVLEFFDRDGRIRDAEGVWRGFPLSTGGEVREGAMPPV